MLIITEKPSVAKDFAAALGCRFSNGLYKNESITITNCIGHLLKLYEPVQYDQTYKSWSNLPIIPEQFLYTINDSVKAQANLVLEQIKNHKNEEILIATDADREGEIIARECLKFAGIKDYSRIKRFWVSQALTKQVILEGIKNAQKLSDYDKLSNQGFARQYSDWLVGINFSRYISTKAEKTLPVGRVQTAILSAINKRCQEVENFIPEKYYEYQGTFSDGNSTLTGLYILDNKTKFSKTEHYQKLNELINKPGKLTDSKTEKKVTPAPQLFNLNELQKEAFKKYELSAAKTLEIVQKLYEEYKCVSYPRTPSKVMGEQNVQLCIDVFERLVSYEPELRTLLSSSYITIQNKRVFNDAKLEAHHALIPLDVIPESATSQEKNVYNLIKERFTNAFLEESVSNISTFTVNVNDNLFVIKASEIIKAGWKQYVKTNKEQSAEEEFQNIKNFDWNKVILSDLKLLEKYTKPKKYFTEASILAFMENPKDEDAEQKLVGLGTAATRHTYIPKLTKIGYIKIDKKNILITAQGKYLLQALQNSSLKNLTDISETTNWEKQLDQEPELFLDNIKTFIRNTVQKEINIQVVEEEYANCPLCQRPIKKGKNNWYCSGYKEGCKFGPVWFSVADATIDVQDIKNICSRKETRMKNCKSKTGKQFKAKFKYNFEKNQLDFIFEKKEGKK